MSSIRIPSKDRSHTLKSFASASLGRASQVYFLLLIVVFQGLSTNNYAHAQEMTAQSLLQIYVAKLDTQHDDVSRALTVFKQGDFIKARKFLETVCTADPALPPARLLLARMFDAANQPVLARAELERVSQRHPTDPGPHLIFAELALSERRFSDAELSFRKARELASKFTANDYRKSNITMRVNQGLAAIAEAREQWPEAVKLLQPVLDMKPGDSSVVARLARSLFKSGDPDGALAVLKKHWSSNKQKIQRPEITMGLFYQDAKDKAKSAEMMKLAAESDVGGAATQSAVAHWALENGELELAKTCANRAWLVDSTLESRMLVALVARYEKDYPKARAMLERIHLESPANLGAMLELSIVLSNIKGEENRGLQFAQLASKLQPDLRKPAGRNAAMSLAWIMFRFGGQAEAEKILQQVLVAGPISAESTYYAAKILISGNRPVAKKLLEEVLENGRMFPDFEDAKKLYENTIW